MGTMMMVLRSLIQKESFMEFPERYLYGMGNGLSPKFGIMAKNIMPLCLKIHFGICTRPSAKKREENRQIGNMIIYLRNGLRKNLKTLYSAWQNDIYFIYNASHSLNSFQVTISPMDLLNISAKRSNWNAFLCSSL